MRRLDATPGASQVFKALALAIVGAAMALMVLASPSAQAAGCPPIKNKPDQRPHVSYAGVRHLTFCDGPITIKPGQNIIRLNQTNLLPKAPGYITRFDPDLIYPSGKVPRVDVLHLHHAVWAVNGAPQFATGEEKSIIQMPKGFGWHSNPTDSWFVNDMIHDLVGQSAKVYIVWRIDFVPDTAPAAASIHTVHTRWMDVTDPARGPASRARSIPSSTPCGEWARTASTRSPTRPARRQRKFVGQNQTWTPDQPVTLIGTVGHLHPGGLDTSLACAAEARRHGVRFQGALLRAGW